MADNERSSSARSGATASLEILTGPARGTATWLSGNALDISLNARDMIRVVEAGGEVPGDDVIARMHRSGDGYEIEARNASTLWINGIRIDSKPLEQRDLLEFGDRGPLTRYRVHRQGDRLRRSLGDMLDDCIDYTRVSRKPRLTRLQNALRDITLDFALETTVLFRVAVVVALVVLAYFSYQQYQTDIRLQQLAETRALQLEDFGHRLTRTDREALRPSDLNRLRQELGHSLSDAAERLALLEQRSEASKRIIAEATRSIVFLQGAYGYRDTESGRMLRYQVDAEGRPLFSLRGQPQFTLDGEGEVAALEFTGTAFLVSEGGAVLTNRHVALPWEDDAGLDAMRERGMQPVLIKFVGYLPNRVDAFTVELLSASEGTDLALLKCDASVAGLPRLRLSERRPEPGDEVIVMGYPTGMRSMLAQTGDRFLAELEADEDLDFWSVAARLSKAQFIRPLASRGIVGQRSAATLVYDAETTHGGSGGPVLDINGEVIAINTAIIPEYGGSNFGIPVEHARRLLREAGIEIE